MCIRDSFWIKPAERVPPTNLMLLSGYQNHTTPFPTLLQPPPSFWIKTILATGDGAPGIDGIPYKFWQSFPRIFATLASTLILSLCRNLHAPPQLEQLLVWIPKAEFGWTGDYWRPLGLPTTFNRAMGLGIYSYLIANIKHLLHPSQTLLNDFKEPQGNILDALDHLSQTRNNPFRAVMATDCVKGFEIINPYWILEVLRARRAPRWLVTYTKYLLFGRRAIAKIQGKLVDPIPLHSGVDMGNAYSVLLFCLAIDPYIVLQNKICLLYTSPSPRDGLLSRMPSSA